MENKYNVRIEKGNVLLFVVCTNDELELPLYVGDSPDDVALKLGISVNTIYHCLSYPERPSKYKYKKISIPEKDFFD